MIKLLNDPYTGHKIAILVARDGQVRQARLVPAETTEETVRAFFTHECDSHRQEDCTLCQRNNEWIIRCLQAFPKAEGNWQLVTLKYWGKWSTLEPLKELLRQVSDLLVQRAQEFGPDRGGPHYADFAVKDVGRLKEAIAGVNQDKATPVVEVSKVEDCPLWAVIDEEPLFF